MDNPIRPLLTRDNFIEQSLAWKRDYHKNYLVMYSSVWNAFSLDPELWGLPPDDHMVHRGDGVFESFKCVDGRLYCVNEHLHRLSQSAAALGISLPPICSETLDLLKEAYKLGKEKDFVVRICVSRGPGSFTVNPYDVSGPEYYLITLRLKRPDPKIYEKGVPIVSAPFPAKSEFMGVKSCDYLHNALVKKYAKDKGVDYAVSFDSEGFLTEGPTENVLVLTKDKRLIAPPWKRILKGVTLGRAMAKGEELVKRGLIKSVENEDVPRENLFDNLSEVFLTTTSFDVLPVVSWDGHPIGDGKPGEVGKELLRLIVDEIHSDNPFTTPLY
jgi:branched-chain amino acid aminotransferase